MTESIFDHDPAPTDRRIDVDGDGALKVKSLCLVCGQEFDGENVIEHSVLLAVVGRADFKTCACCGRQVTKVDKLYKRRWRRWAQRYGNLTKRGFLR